MEELILVAGIMYRIQCEDGPQHDAVPSGRLYALVASGHLDLEDRVALAGTDAWMRAWEMDALFEPCVVHALQLHRDSTTRMHRSIKTGWITLMQYREQRDQILMAEPDVNASQWSLRARPDLVRAHALTELQVAAAEGAAAERAACLRGPAWRAEAAVQQIRNDQGQLSIKLMQQNVQRFIQGDVPAWADPRTLLDAWRHNGVKMAIITVLTVALLDLFATPQPIFRLLIGVIGTAAVCCMLLQLFASSDDRRWARRFSNLLVVLVCGATLLVARGTIDHSNGAFAHWSPQIAQLQNDVKQKISKLMSPTPAPTKP